jgi:outer membrane protein OmpA-like peptidoglycan-associated protein
VRAPSLWLLGYAAMVSSSISAFAETPSNWLFLGTDVGYLATSASNPLEVSKSGAEAGVKLVVSHYFDHVVADLGGGYLYSAVSGEGLGAVKKVQVITRAAYFELSPRYLLGSHWQLGPVAQLVTGEDVSYDEDGAVNEKGSHWRLGARAQYEVGDEWRWRFGVQAFTDLDISNRNIIGVVADIQFGFSPFSRSPASTPVVAKTFEIEKPAFAEVHGESIRLYLPEDLLRFKTASSKLDGKSKQAIKKLSKILTKYENSWKKMRVEGHTDVRNASGQNQVLSEKRAQVVKELLIESKLPAAKMTSQGLAATQPIDPALNYKAYAINRRVEIWLDQVSPDQIEQIMAELKQF